jgi:uncharacterized protein YxjI
MSVNSLNPTALNSIDKLFIRQRHEAIELFGFETRNKYEIQTLNKETIGYAAEQGKGFLSTIARLYLGHWRTFDIHLFNAQREQLYVAHHPFRWYFQELIVQDMQGVTLGTIRKRFSLLSKSFEVSNAMGQIIFEVSSPIWKIWTFPFLRQGREMARVSKKWSGLLSEGFTDKDNFLVEFLDPMVKDKERLLLLMAGIFIDLLFFENKAN